MMHSPVAKLVLRLCSLGMLTGIALSTTLWSTIRTYPLAPFIRGFSLPEFYTFCITLILCVALVWIIYRPNSIRAPAITIGALILLVAADQSRLQPWVYYYSAVIVAGIIALRTTNEARFFQLCAIIIGGTYVLSGIQKINPHFVREIMPWMAEPLTSSKTLIHIAAYSAPFIEIAVGIGLWFKQTRVAAIAGAIALWAIVLLSIGPFGHDWNTVVWPWITIHTALAVLVARHFTAPIPIRGTVLKIYSALFLFLPLLSITNLWDAYLSASLYSGTIPQVTIFDTSTNTTISLATWSYDELNVPPYPQPRVYRSIFRTLCEQFPHPLILRIHYYDLIRDGRFEVVRCE